MILLLGNHHRDVLLAPHHRSSIDGLSQWIGTGTCIDFTAAGNDLTIVRDLAHALREIVEVGSEYLIFAAKGLLDHDPHHMTPNTANNTDILEITELARRLRRLVPDATAFLRL